THFEHAGEPRHAFCPACCARGLVALPCFAVAGGAGIKPGINGVPPMYLLPQGQSLFETLLLNYLIPTCRPEALQGPDPGPLWEGSGVVELRGEKATAGFVESLTWPPRRVRLYPGEGGPCSRCGEPSPVLVRKMVFAQGRSRPRGAPLWRG